MWLVILKVAFSMCMLSEGSSIYHLMFCSSAGAEMLSLVTQFWSIGGHSPDNTISNPHLPNITCHTILKLQKPLTCHTTLCIATLKHHLPLTCITTLKHHDFVHTTLKLKKPLACHTTLKHHLPHDFVQTLFGVPATSNKWCVVRRGSFWFCAIPLARQMVNRDYLSLASSSAAAAPADPREDLQDKDTTDCNIQIY